MSVIRVNFLPEFHYGDDAVLLTLDGGGVDDFKAALGDAERHRSSRLEHDGVVQFPRAAKPRERHSSKGPGPCSWDAGSGSG